MPNSPGATSDDKILTSLAHFNGKDIVITEKMDGENTSIYTDGYVHARSIDGRTYPWQSWIKSTIVPKIIGNLPINWRVCGENVYAKHSIEYTELSSFFYMFSLWDELTCQSWDMTVLYAEMLEIELVPVLYHGPFNQATVDSIIASLDLTKQEGIVMRTTGNFSMSDFNLNVAKYVRKNHVQTDQHWAHQEIIPNKLKENKQ